jgi:L-rhamnose mutarotase
MNINKSTFALHYSYKGWMLSSLFILLFSCNEIEKSQKKFRWMVMTTELVNDENIIRMYDSLHGKAGIWPAIRKANQASGIEEIRIYRFGNRLTMMVRIPENIDLKKMDSLYVAADEKVKLWGKIMSDFQRALPGVDTSQKWVEMQLIHHYLDGEYLK